MRRGAGVSAGAVAVLLLSAVSGQTQGLTGDITRDPADVIEKYAQLDYKGARLNASSQQVLHPYTAWREEPAWGAVVVVEGYRVLDQTTEWEIISMLEVRIPVEYRVLGVMYWDSASFLSDPGSERVVFRVEGRDMRWRIVEPLVPPHVGIKRMINFVRHAMLQETDPARLARLTALRDELERAR